MGEATDGHGCTRMGTGSDGGGDWLRLRDCQCSGSGIRAQAQVSFPVCYKGQYVGEYMADLVVEEKLIVELKCVDRFANEHLAPCINFQRPKVEWKRVLLDP